jgi:hypothetical protein
MSIRTPRARRSRLLVGFLSVFALGSWAALEEVLFVMKSGEVLKNVAR